MGTYPNYIPTRGISVGGASTMESATALLVTAVVRSTKSLVWDATGYRFEQVSEQFVGTLPGEQVSFILPCTDTAGWRDPSTNTIIDVSAENSYTHRYYVDVSFSLNGKSLPNNKYTIGPFVLPAGDNSVVDLDKYVIAASSAGDFVAIPDSWTAQIEALREEIDNLPGGGGGGGSVDSVNGISPDGNGNIALTADNISDGTSKVTMTLTERGKLAGIAFNATANDTDANLKNRANHSGTQASATISDLTEVVQDIVGALIVAGTNTSVTYNDAAGTFTINATTGGSTDPEVVRDTIGGALVAGSGIQITVNDAGDTITIASTAVLPTRQIATGNGLSGGGDLGSDRSLAVDFGTGATQVPAGNSVVRLSGDQSISGSKTFTSAPVVPDSSFSIVKINGLQNALDAKADNSGIVPVVFYSAGAYTYKGTAITSWPSAITGPALVLGLASTDTPAAWIPTNALILLTDGESTLTESIQDVVGGMVTSAGGTYDDTAGTITLPSGGGDTTINQFSTLDSGWGKFRAALARRAVGPVPIVYCGTSTVAGNDASEAAKRFVNLLTASLKAAYSSPNDVPMRTLAEAVAAKPLVAGIQGVNAGVAGVYSSQYLTDSTCIDIGGLNPLVVFHVVTSNDYAGNINPATTATNIAGWIDKINAAVTSGITPLHILVQPFHRGDVLDGSVTYAWDMYASALKGLADTRSDTVFVNTSPFFDAVGLPTSNASGILSATNGPHLSDVGHVMFADILRTAMEIPDVPQTAQASTNPIVACDTYNRADQTGVGTADTGQTWSSLFSGQGNIAGGKLSVPAANTYTGLIDCGKTNVDASVDITWQGQVTSINLRSDASGNNRISLSLVSPNVMRCYSTIANTTTTVNSDVTMGTSLTVGATYQLRAVLTGTTLQGYLDNVLVGTWTIPTDLNNATQYLTRVGLRVASTGTVIRTLDNFIVRAL